MCGLQFEDKNNFRNNGYYCGATDWNNADNLQALSQSSFNSEFDRVVGCMHQVLLGSEISLRRLD